MPAPYDSLVVTFAANAKANAPTVTVKAQTEALLELKLQALENNGTLATIARTANAFGAMFNVGDILGAQLETPALESAPVAVAHNHTPAPAQPELPAPDPATDAAAYALNQQRQAPQPNPNQAAVQQLPGQTALPAPAAPSPLAAQPAAATGAAIYQNADMPPIVAAPQPGGLPGQTGVDPTGRPLGPFLPGLNMPAVFVTGTGRSGEWRAWADPRSQQVTQSIQARTPVADDPALAAGHASFWDWIR